MKTGVAVIGMIDVQESACRNQRMHFMHLEKLQETGTGIRVILQISAIFGNCGGGLAVFPTLTDFTLMEESGQLFVNAPNAITGNRKEVLNSASAAFQSKEAGVVDFVGNEAEVLPRIKEVNRTIPIKL